MGFFTTIKKTYEKAKSTISKAVSAVKATTATKAPSIPAPTKQQMAASAPASIQQSKDAGNTKQIATTSTQQTSPGNPIENVAQPASSTAISAKGDINLNTPSGVGKSSNALQSSIFQNPDNNVQVSSGTFDPSVDEAFHTTTAGVLAAGALTAGASFGAGFVASVIARNIAINSVKTVTNPTAANNLMKVGTKGLENVVNAYTKGTAGKIAVNSATKVATQSWFLKLAKGVSNPMFVVSTLIGAIGSYPFAGFIKEEALQTISFATTVAYQNKDVAGMEAAITLQNDVLNNDLWEGIIAAVPYANVIAKLKEFYEAAKLKTTIDQKMFEDLKIQIETGETENEKWARLNEEKAAQEKALIDYYNQERMKLLEWEREAEEQARNEDAAFWRAEREKKAAEEAADREAQAAFWAAYKKAQQKAADDSRPSKLNFGIL